MLHTRRPLLTAVLAGAMTLGATACDDEDLDVDEEETTVEEEDTVVTETEAPTATEPDATATTTEESTE